jgi:hypothetical protein
MTSDPLFNTVSANRILRSFGKVLDPNVEFHIEKHDLFTTDRVDIFFSHVWSSHPKLRLLGVLWHLNWARAIVLSLFIVAVTAGLLQTLVDGRVWTKIEARAGLTVQSILAIYGILLTLFFLVVSETMIRSYSHCFLDRCCIEQAESTEKREGIAKIPSILSRTTNLAVLLSDNYFQRLWCVYEVAVYRSCSPTKSDRDRITFIPLRIVLITVVMTIADALSTVLFRSNIRPLLSNQQESTFLMISVGFSFVVALLTYMFSLLWLRGLHRYRAQLGSFSLMKLECTDEADRISLLADIDKRFSGISNFETYVRTEVLRQIAARPRFTNLLWIGLPSLFSIIGYIDIIFQRMGLFCMTELKKESFKVNNDSFCSILDRPIWFNICVMVSEILGILLYYPVIISVTLTCVNKVSRLKAKARLFSSAIVVALLTGLTFAHFYQYEEALVASLIKLGILAFVGILAYLYPRRSKRRDTGSDEDSALLEKSK